MTRRKISLGFALSLAAAGLVFAHEYFRRKAKNVVFVDGEALEAFDPSKDPVEGPDFCAPEGGNPFFSFGRRS
jgi:hypothetical protein